MPRHDALENVEIRTGLDRAYDALRTGDPSGAVRTLSETYLRLLALRPELLRQRVRLRAGRPPVVAALAWPRLGANLQLDSLRTGAPRIEFARERFALSEALTYYEFLVETARRAERPTEPPGPEDLSPA